MLFVDSAVVVSVSVLFRGDNGVGITFLGKSEVKFHWTIHKAYIQGDKGG